MQMPPSTRKSLILTIKPWRTTCYLWTIYAIADRPTSTRRASMIFLNIPDPWQKSQEFTNFTDDSSHVSCEKQSRGLDRTSIEHFEMNFFDVNGDTTGQPTGNSRSPGSYVCVCKHRGKFLKYDRCQGYFKRTLYTHPSHVVRIVVVFY